MDWLDNVFEAKYGKGKIPTAREEALQTPTIDPVDILTFPIGGFASKIGSGLAKALKTAGSWALANVPYDIARAVDMPELAALGIGLAAPAGIQIGAGKLAGRLAQHGAGVANLPKGAISSLGKKLSSVQKPTIEGLVRQKGGVPAIIPDYIDVEFSQPHNLLTAAKSIQQPAGRQPSKMLGPAVFEMPGVQPKAPGELSATVKNVLEGTYAGGKKLTGQDLANALEKVQRKTALRKAVEKMFGKEVKKSPVSKTREVAKTVPSEGGRLIGNIPITESKEVIPYLYSTTRDMQAIDTGATKVVAGQTWRHVKYVKSSKLEAQLKKEWPEDLGKLKEPLYSEWVPDFTLKRGK